MHIPFINSILGYLQGDGATILPEIELVLFGLGILVIDFWIEEKEKYLNAGMALAGTVFSAFTLWRLRGVAAARGEFAGFHQSVIVDPFFLFFATLFLADPTEYDGGELVIGEGGDEKQVKLPAGDMVLYSGGTVHRVMPVTRGVRVAAFFWVQSMVRDETRRAILFDFDNALQRLGRTAADHDACVRLAGVYHNLLRQWADS